MTFVNEKISDEDKKKYGFGIDKDLWVIDRDKNAFLISTGGGYEPYSPTLLTKLFGLV